MGEESVKSTPNARAFTQVELLCVLAVALLFLCLLVATFWPVSRPSRGNSGHERDYLKLRGIHSAMELWAEQHQGSYPLPSRIDLANTTTREVGSAKNTTSNIYSVLMFGGYISFDSVISGSESNPRISSFESYALEAPPSAVDPGSALWDPAFTADFTAPGGGHASFAHLQPAPSGGRLKNWGQTFAPTTAIVSNRGPEVRLVVDRGEQSPLVTFVLANSNTLLIHGTRDTWEGHVVYADGHGAFETSVAPDDRRYLSSSGWRRDVLFYDETDNPNRDNVLLGIFTTAGDSAANFTAIWD